MNRRVAVSVAPRGAQTRTYNDLRDYLVGVGVGPDGGKWSYRELEAASDRCGWPVGKDTWYRAQQKLPRGVKRRRFIEKVTEGMEITLRSLGVPVPAGHISELGARDSGTLKTSGDTLKTGDNLADVLASVVVDPGERMALYRSLITAATFEERWDMYRELLPLLNSPDGANGHDGGGNTDGIHLYGDFGPRRRPRHPDGQ